MKESRGKREEEEGEYENMKITKREHVRVEKSNRE